MTGSGSGREIGWPWDGSFPGSMARRVASGLAPSGNRLPAYGKKFQSGSGGNSSPALRSWVSRTFLLAISIIAGLHVAYGQAALPSDNLSYPVLITLGNGATGSGFFLGNEKAVYLVTAKHVLFNPTTGGLLDPRAELISYSKDPADSTRNSFAVDLTVLAGDRDIRPHPSEDVVVVRVGVISASNPQSSGSPSVSLVPGVMITERARLGITWGDLNSGVKTFDQVIVGNDVVLFGYPTSLALQQLPQLDVHHPLLRKGIVAGTNPATRTLILDCPAYFGNSGGPVVEVDHEGFQTTYKVIGVMNMYVPFVDTGHAFQMASNSGYSIATPMDFVLELVRQFSPNP
ncbi:MAG: trypsin-like peptidase domain-containing protein [Terriglobia bacterium]